MDAIKKKMQAMKLEKDNALDRALLCEQQARDANLRAEKAEEEARQLQKKIQAIENDLDVTQETLMQVNTKLEEKEKALQNRNPDCCSRPKQLRAGGSNGSGKRKQHSKKGRRRSGRARGPTSGGRGGRGNGARRRRSSEIVRRLPKHAEAPLRLENGTRCEVEALSNTKKRHTNGFRTSILKLVDSTFDTELWDRAGEPADIFVAANKQDVVNGAAGDGGGSVVGASIMCENNSGPGPGAGGRKRGHQHHPRFGGTRQSTVPAEDVIAALRGAFDGGSNSLSSSSLSSSASSLNVSISGGGGGSDRAVTGNDGTSNNNNNNNNNPLASESTSFAKRSDDNDAELLDEYEIGSEATATTTAAAIVTADIVNSNIETSNITALGARWSGEPSKENTPEPEQDLLNNNRSISSSNRSSVSPKNVIQFDEPADIDGRPLSMEPPSRTTEPDDEESIELKLDQITSGKELVQQINKKLKRSKRSPQSDDAGGGAPPSGKKKSSSTGKKSSSKTSSGTGPDGVKRKKSKSAAAAAAAAAALEQRASGDGASCDLDAVIGGLLGAAEYGGGLAGDYKEPQNDENDPDVAEWAKLRCTSERTEVIAEREHRRQKRCADYPGLAFGRSIFSSDTMMKFNIIRNELHNIMKTQLKR
uniref:Tropomyosin n=1 Tax=Anopheles christyi TaxID=43041 RepID=A0A182K5B7_9DIPT